MIFIKRNLAICMCFLSMILGLHAADDSLRGSTPDDELSTQELVQFQQSLETSDQDTRKTTKIPPRKRLRKISDARLEKSSIKKRPRTEVSEELGYLSEDEPIKAPQAKHKALASKSNPSFPKFRPSQSIFKNSELDPDLTGTVIVYDSETTTLSPKCGGRFVELAAIKIIDGSPRETLHIMFNPDMKSWAGAFKAHGLHESYLRAQAHFYSVAKYIEDFFGQDVRCAHNGFKFDDPYLNFEMRRARVFWQLRQMISPDQTFVEQAPRSALITPEQAQRGHAVLRELGIVQDTVIPENLEEKTNLLAAAAMLYFFKDHMTQSETGYNNEKKPGPLMFRDGNMLPDADEYRENHEAAVARLAWFRLIRQDTETYEQRAKLKQPYDKYIRDAIQSAEVYLSAVVKIFHQNILDEVSFRADPVDAGKMFDTLVYTRGHQEQFTRAVTVDNLKLDSLIDYFHLNRHARETGTHGAAIDTSLLYQVLLKLVGTAVHNAELNTLLAKPQTEIEEFLFAKNSIRYFDEKCELVSTAQLHDDQIPGTTRERNGRREEVSTPASAPSYAALMSQTTQPTTVANSNAPQPMMPTQGMPGTGMMMPQQMPWMQFGFPQQAMMPFNPYAATGGMPGNYMSGMGMMMPQQIPYTGMQFGITTPTNMNGYMTPQNSWMGSQQQPR